MGRFSSSSGPWRCASSGRSSAGPQAAHPASRRRRLRRHTGKAGLKGLRSLGWWKGWEPSALQSATHAVSRPDLQVVRQLFEAGDGVEAAAVRLLHCCRLHLRPLRAGRTTDIAHEEIARERADWLVRSTVSVTRKARCSVCDRAYIRPLCGRCRPSSCRRRARGITFGSCAESVFPVGVVHVAEEEHRPWRSRSRLPLT